MADVEVNDTPAAAIAEEPKTATAVPAPEEAASEPAATATETSSAAAPTPPAHAATATGTEVEDTTAASAAVAAAAPVEVVTAAENKPSEATATIASIPKLADEKLATEAAAAEQTDGAADDKKTTTTTTAADATNTSADEKESKPTKSAIQQLWDLAAAHGHQEVWGVTLADPDTHVPSQIVLQKYLNANDGDLTKAKDQLTKTLDWRRDTKPLELLEKSYSKAKFEGLGYATVYRDEKAEDASAPEAREVFTWNIYGGVKSIDETFGDLDEFIRWRVALMELALRDMSLTTATKPITAEHDPYKMYQVHDYKSISFLRQSPQVKSASTKTIEVFAQNYPELLKEKFFVNVPAIMGFVYSFMKLFVAAKTIKKFHPMSNGGNLAREFGESKVHGLGEMLPKEYGGKGQDLKALGKEPGLE